MHKPKGMKAPGVREVDILGSTDMRTHFTYDFSKFKRDVKVNKEDILLENTDDL